MSKAMENKLRVFKDLDDLFDSATSEKIFEWVNAHAKAIDYRKSHQKVYQGKRRLLMKYAKEQMAPDELRRIEQMAEESIINGQEAEGETEDSQA